MGKPWSLGINALTFVDLVAVAALGCVLNHSLLTSTLAIGMGSFLLLAVDGDRISSSSSGRVSICKYVNFIDIYIYRW